MPSKEHGFDKNDTVFASTPQLSSFLESALESKVEVRIALTALLESKTCLEVDPTPLFLNPSFGFFVFHCVHLRMLKI